MRPRQLWHYTDGGADAVSLTVSYMEAIAAAHPFEQGNKRTGFDAGFIFLKSNGLDLIPDADSELVAVRFLELLDRTSPFHCTVDEFETFLSEYIVPAPNW